MSLIMRPKKTSAAYTAAVLQALQESQHAVGNFLGESGTVEYMEHQVNQNELAFASSAAEVWGVVHSDLISTILPNHEGQWNERQYGDLTKFRIWCLQDCILQYLEEATGDLNRKVTRALELAEENAATK